MSAKPPPRDREFLAAALEIVETPASPIGRAIAGTIIAFLCLASGWAAIGTVDIISTAQGRIIPTGRSKIIQPFETGVVRAIRVKDGESVAVGDVLIELDPATDASDEKRLVFSLAQDRLDTSRLKALLAGQTTLAPPSVPVPSMLVVAQAEMDAQAAEHTARLDMIDRQIGQKTAEGRGLTAVVDKLRASLPLISEQRDIRSTLLGNQYGSRLTYLQTQQQVVETEHELDVQKQHQDENAQALAALSRQRAGADAEYRKGLLTDLAKAEVQASEHAEDMAKADIRRGLRTLHAPVAGTVQQLAVNTLGGIVTPAEHLMVIVPKEGGLEIEARLENRDVGFVHQGQEVDVKVETFDFTRYGLLHGRVASISEDAVAGTESGESGRGGGSLSGADDRDHQAQRPFYVAHIALAETGVATEQGFARLDPGMAVTAEIKTGRRTILDFLLSPMSRFRQESLRER